ncbi:MAG: hypothetical protein ACE14M_13000 [Terriglobales bacterium]
MGVVVRAGIPVLETLFAVGCFGSAVVLLLSGIEDVRTALQKGKPGDETR